MPTIIFDHPGFAISGPYVTDMKRRPVHEAHLAREGDSIVITTPPGVRFMLHVSLGVEGFGRTFCTADRGGEGYSGSGKFLLLRELAFSHMQRAERTVSANEVDTPAELVEAREKYALGTWRDWQHNSMIALAHALVAGEEAARAAAERTLANRDRSAHPGPLISGTLFGERLNDWSIGVGPDWDPATEPPDFVRPLSENESIAAICNAATLPTFWRWIEPQRGKPRWDVLDNLVEFSVQRNLKIKSFALCWGGIGGTPMWLRGLSQKEKLRAIENWITQIVGRYKDHIDVWETLNEMHDWSFGDPYGWSHAQTLEVTRMVNELVGALDPGKPRIINNCTIWGDYTQNHPGQWAPLTYLEDVIQAGIPFEGIGVQYYNPGRDLLECAQQLDTYAELGKTLWVTEMGTPADQRQHGQVETGQLDPLVGWRGPWSLKSQADWVELWYTLASARPSLKALNWWDCGDERAFIAHAGWLDMQGQPKPVYTRLQAWCQKFGIGKT